MFFFLLFIVLIVISNSNIYSKNKFNVDYLSKENTLGIKGLFVVLVFFSHFVQYVSLESVWDVPYLELRKHLNQMVVAPFLFYSGVGTMISIQKKGKEYIQSLITKRFFRVWFDFVVAVFLFLVIDILLGKTYPIKKILFSFVGWDSIGNSNWYILAILILYILTYLAFKISGFFRLKCSEIFSCLILTMLVVGTVFFLMIVGRPDYYYNTLIIFPIGCWYVLFKKKIETIFTKNDFYYLLGLTMIVAAYCWMYIHRWDYGIEGYSIWALLFVALFVLVTMKFSFKSNFFNWFGAHVFSVYILQRIPMMVLAHFGIAKTHKYMFLILSMLMTMVLALIFEWCTQLIINKWDNIKMKRLVRH